MTDQSQRTLATAASQGRPPLTKPARRDFFGRMTPALVKHRPLVLKLVSAAVVFGAWEIAGRIPVSYAFPTFIEFHGGALVNDHRWLALRRLW